MISLVTAGESHGPAVTAILSGIPAGLGVSREWVDAELARRQRGYGRGGRMQIERDRVRFTGGVRHGVTLGAPICLVIENRDWENWREEMSSDVPAPGWQSDREVRVPRPGHADLAGGAKFGHSDLRNVLERASARETAARVAAGAICKLLLAEVGITVRSRTLAIGGVWDDAPVCDDEDWERVENSDVRCADESAAQAMRAAIDRAAAQGDSVGGALEVVAEGVPPGLGSYASWPERLDGQLAQAVMSVPGIKAVEFGAGWRVANLTGSEVHDEIVRCEARWPFARPTNHAGGVEGGVSNGAPLVLRAAMKPIPTLRRPLRSVDLRSGESADAHAERSDVCAVPAAGVVAEAMVALVLADAVRTKFGGDCMADLKAAWQHYLDRLALPWGSGG